MKCGRNQSDVNYFNLITSIEIDYEPLPHCLAQTKLHPGNYTARVRTAFSEVYVSRNSKKRAIFGLHHEARSDSPRFSCMLCFSDELRRISAVLLNSLQYSERILQYVRPEALAMVTDSDEAEVT